MKVKIYHYPKCSTSKASLDFLKSKGIDPVVVLYCERSFERAEILHLMRLLHLSHTHELVNKKSMTYRHLGLAKKDLTDEEWIEVIIKNPKLLQRPIVVVDDKRAVICKNPEILTSIL